MYWLHEEEERAEETNLITPTLQTVTTTPGMRAPVETDIPTSVTQWVFLFALLFLCVACFAFLSGVPRLLLMSSIYAAAMLGFMVSNHI